MSQELLFYIDPTLGHFNISEDYNPVICPHPLPGDGDPQPRSGPPGLRHEADRLAGLHPRLLRGIQGALQHYPRGAGGDRVIWK